MGAIIQIGLVAVLMAVSLNVLTEKLSFLWLFSAETSLLPIRSAQNFVSYHEQRLSNTSIEIGDIPIDIYQSFRGGAYAKAQTMQDLRKGMEDQLSNVPPEVVAQISRRAFSEHLDENQLNFADTVSNLGTDGSVTTFMGYLHTWKTADGSVASFIVLSGSQIKSGSVIAGYDEREETVVIGHNHHCFIRCSKVAITSTVRSRFPIMKKASLTYNQQVALRTRMVADAIESANVLIAQIAGSNYKNRIDTGSVDDDQPNMWSIIDNSSLAHILTEK